MVGERGDGGVGRRGVGRFGALVGTHPAFGPPSPSSPNMAAIIRFLPFCACDRPDILSRLCDVLPSLAAWPGTGSYLGYPVVGLCCPVIGSTSPRHTSARAASSTSSSRQREPDACMGPFGGGSQVIRGGNYGGASQRKSLAFLLGAGSWVNFIQHPWRAYSSLTKTSKCYVLYLYLWLWPVHDGYPCDQ